MVRVDGPTIVRLRSLAARAGLALDRPVSVAELLRGMLLVAEIEEPNVVEALRALTAAVEPVEDEPSPERVNPDDPTCSPMLALGTPA